MELGRGLFHKLLNHALVVLWRPGTYQTICSFFLITTKKLKLRWFSIEVDEYTRYGVEVLLSSELLMNLRVDL